ncbi:hypothetical protein FRB94_009109 [Tulasnella sp. JGI-2019a]|nr:hypothetical protein FRB94_009109 [Tulasnella sp. JGI-2019a]KAG8998610.1 hypothetical protein FRB93_013542 [Tulasnella sp. JGI-2019a]KAG9034497.1 hypothetical protein FRB95_013173 [Tulasnella sp. JGI-2019a]
MAHQRPERNLGDMEIGVANVVAEHETRAPPPIARAPNWLLAWEARRPKWLMECFAEAMGMFLYVYCGLGAGAAFSTTASAGVSGFGSLFSIGWAYGIGITLSIMIAGPTSGSHLNPAYTIAFAIFKGFPWKKVPQYIISQIFGAFLAALVVYGAYKQELDLITMELQAAGPIAAAKIFSPEGPAGVFALFTAPGQSLGYVFLSEIFATAVLSLVVFTILDLSNPFICTYSAPVLIGMAYAVVIWAFAPASLVLNTARDLGGRFVAGIVWGRGAFPMQYSALAALTNILGALLGASIQILFLADSRRPVSITVPADEVHRFHRTGSASVVGTPTEEKRGLQLHAGRSSSDQSTRVNM